MEVVGNEEEKMFTILVNQEALLLPLHGVTDVGCIEVLTPVLVLVHPSTAR